MVGMSIDKDLQIEKVLEILEERVFQRAGRYLSKAEKLVIKGSWEGKDYKEIACNSGYSAYYLQSAIGPSLWIMLSDVIDEGVKVKKTTLKKVLLEVVRKDLLKQEVSKLDSDALVGKTRTYGELPEIASIYGRKEDISYLKNQIKLFKQRCISITGIGGIGKSVLVAQLIEEILIENSNAYDYVIWKNVDVCSSLDEIIRDIIKIFNLQLENEPLIKQISLVAKQLRLCRCLLVIDGFEKLAQSENFGRNKKLEYEHFFIEITKEQYQSCTIITSQLPLKEFAYLITNLPILYFKLEGLEVHAAMQMLYEKGLKGEECKELIDIYRGNPSELEAVANKINRYFAGSVQKFIECRTTVIGSRFQLMLHFQFGHPGFLSKLQRQVLIYLAEQLREDPTPIKFSEIIKYLKKQLGELSISEVIADMEILEQRSLVETTTKANQEEVSYNLQPVVKKYILIDPLGFVREEPDKTQINNYIQAVNTR